LLHTPSQQIYKSSAYFRHKASRDTYIEAIKDLNDKIGWVCFSSLRNRAESTGELGETILLERKRLTIGAVDGVAGFRRLVADSPSGGREFSDSIDGKIGQARKHRAQIVANW
jgi:hypothetical protein